MELLTPRAVPADGHIRVVSPSSDSLGHLTGRTERALAVLRGLGYEVSLGRHAHETADRGGVVSAESRATDLLEAFVDPRVDAILSADAGEGAREVVEHLDPAAIRLDPKYFVGYCDNVYLNQFLLEQGVVSLYGATLLGHLGDQGGPFEETVTGLLAAIGNKAPLTLRPMPSRTGERLNWAADELSPRRRRRWTGGGWTWLRGGTGRGRFVGGELRTLGDEAFGVDLDAAVLFWHLAYGAPAVEPLFARAVRRHDLASLAGMVVGAHPDVPLSSWAAAVARLVDAYLPEAEFPIVVNADISHMDPGWTVPYGEVATVSAETDTIVFPRQHEAERR